MIPRDVASGQDLCRPPFKATKPEICHFETLPRNEQVWVLGYLGGQDRWEACMRDLAAYRAWKAAAL